MYICICFVHANKDLIINFVYKFHVIYGVARVGLCKLGIVLRILKCF